MDKDWRDAVQQGQVERLGELLDAGADINGRDRYGQTGLMIAAGDGRSNIVQLLIERGAGLDYTAKYGLSAVMLAVINGHLDIVRMLVQAGANLELRGTGVPGFHGKTALDLAEARGGQRDGRGAARRCVSVRSSHHPTAWMPTGP